jgi:four helix bundle protein
MALTSYKELQVWTQSVDLVVLVYELTRTFPRDERFGLVTQMRRSAVSVPSNIAEGYGRGTRGEYRNQLSVARGSACELETLTILAQRLGLADTASTLTILRAANDLQRMLSRLRSRLADRDDP